MLSITEAAQLAFLKCYLRGANWLLAATAFLIFPRRSRSGARTLVFRMGSIGDMVVAIPALKALHREAPTRLCLLTATAFRAVAAKLGYLGADLLEGSGLVQEVIQFTPSESLQRVPRSQVRRRIEAFTPDRVVILPYTSETFFRMLAKLVTMRLIGITVRPEGWKLGCDMRRFGDAQFKAGMIEHQAVVALRATSATGTQQELMSRYSCELSPSGTAAAKVEAVLFRAGVPKGEPLLLVAASSKFAHKRWPVERFAESIDRVREQFSIHCVLVGGAADFDLGETLRSKLHAPNTNLCGKLSLTENLELARRSVAYLGNDSGPAHLAAAAGTSTVAIFSGIHYPGIWEPWNELGQVVRHPVPCQYCKSELECPAGTQACILGITVDQVVASLVEVLRRASAVDKSLQASRTRCGQGSGNASANVSS